DPEAILDPARSLEAGALVPFDVAELRPAKRRLLRALAAAGVPLDRPVARLGARHRRLVLEGSAELPGALTVLREALAAEDGAALAEFTVERPCAECAGQRLNARARAVRLAGRTIAELTALPVSDAEQAIGALRFEAREGQHGAGGGARRGAPPPRRPGRRPGAGRRGARRAPGRRRPARAARRPPRLSHRPLPGHPAPPPRAEPFSGAATAPHRARRA